MIKHGHARKNHASKMYIIYCGMLGRCYNPNNEKYYRYGGRGIRVSERWLDNFLNFLEDMKECPKGFSLGRIDNDEGYRKENCEWQTAKQQANNRSTNRIIIFNGRSQTLHQWADELGINQSSLRERLEKWSLEKSLTFLKSNGRITTKTK